MLWEPTYSTSEDRLSYLDLFIGLTYVITDLHIQPDIQLARYITRSQP